MRQFVAVRARVIAEAVVPQPGAVHTQEIAQIEQRKGKAVARHTSALELFQCYRLLRYSQQQ